MENQRKKSCRQCRLAKTRCNLAVPHCQRCERRSLPCKYESRSINHNGAPSNDGNPFHSWVIGTRSAFSDLELGQGSTPQIEEQAGLDQTTNNAPISDLLNFDIALNPSIEDMYRTDMEWNNERAIYTEAAPETGARPSVLTENENQQNVCWYEFSSNASSGSRSPIPRQAVPLTASDGSRHVTDFIISMMQGSPFDMASWQSLDKESNKLPNLLNRKPSKTAGSLLTKNFLWSTIKSHAFSFENGALPFFIHRQSSPEICQSDNTAEPLANCRSIISMYRQKTPASTGLVLRTLLLEIQRIYEQSSTCDKITFLHGIQALTIYAIVVAADEDRCNIVSFVIRLALGEIAAKISRNEWLPKSVFPSWKDWVQAVSKQRTLLVIYLLDVLLDLNIGTPRPSGCLAMDEIPLPCVKAVWEAETEASWKKEYIQYLSTRNRGTLLTVGDLRRSNNMDVDNIEVDIRDDLSNWADGVDGLGALLLTGILGK